MLHRLPHGLARTPLLGLVALLLLAACGDGDVETQPTPGPTPAPSPSPTPPASPTEGALPEGWALCTNEDAGFAIGYPEDWQADAPGLEQQCALFDPEPFEVEPATEAPVTAMIVEMVEQPFEDMAASLEDPHGERVLTLEETTVAGRQAMRFEAVQTEDLLYPEGTQRYGYAVEADGRTLLVMTLDVAGTDTDYEGNKEVVDQAAETVRFDV